MSQSTNINKYIAAYLRDLAPKCTERFGNHGPEDFMRERANELDPPSMPLPTEPGWYPNISARDRGYRPGAIRLSASWYELARTNWMVLTDQGTAHGVDNDQVEVRGPSQPRVFSWGVPCPEVGTKMYDQDDDTWVVIGENLIWVKDRDDDYTGCECPPNWQMHLKEYGPMTEVLP